MKKQKRFFAGGLVVVGAALLFVVLSMIFCSGNEEKKITKFVTANQTELENIALSCLNWEDAPDEYKGVKVEGVYPGEHPIVQFFHSGKGLVPSSVYYGFYYSKDNEPAAYQNIGSELESVSDHEWKWNDGTDNGGLTKRITDCWFYYEAKF